MKEQNLIVLEDLSFAEPKTKEFVKMLSNLPVGKKALFVTDTVNTNVELSSRNIPGVTIIEASNINVLDVVGHETLVMTKAAVEKVEEVLS